MGIVMICQIHNRKFSEHFDANFHEQLNIGCKWQYIQQESLLDKILEKIGIEL